VGDSDLPKTTTVRTIMRTTTKAALLLSASSLIWHTVGNAQQAQENPAFAAIDAYQCNYRDGKGPDDLMKVTGKWNKWMDKNSSAPYSAWIMHPVLSSTNMPIDVVWLGAWQNGNDMGKGMQEWADKGDALNAEFLSVIDCGEHSLAASINIRPPAKSWPEKEGVAAFANCTLGEGHTIPDAMAVHQAWAKHLDANGSKAGMWAFFPGAGNNNPEWDYKIVVSHPDYISFGADWDNFTNGQGWRKAMELGSGKVVSCDSPRVYHSATVRNGGVTSGG
jgi:hypothetical protein